MAEKIVLTKKKGENYTILVFYDQTRRSIHSEIRAKELKTKKGKVLYLIENHHFLGGGDSGWSDYSDFLDIVNKKSQLQDKLREWALSESMDLAKKLKVNFEDKTKHSQTQPLCTEPRGISDDKGHYIENMDHPESH